MKKAENLKEYVERMDNLKKLNPKDLSSDQDLSIGIMNLISIEEHLMFSGSKTGKTSFYDLINEYEGEVWCISKHLLSSSMRLMEVGTKQLSMNRKEVAYKLFAQSYDLYCLFWGLNTNLIDVKDVKWIADDTKDIEKISADLEKAKKDIAVSEKLESDVAAEIKEEASKPAEAAAASGGVFGRLKGTIMKVVDCCIE